MQNKLTFLLLGLFLLCFTFLVFKPSTFLGNQLQSAAPRNITIYEWMRCVESTPCPIQCRVNDTACYQAGNDHYQCQQNTTSCQQWTYYFEHSEASKPMPPSYYNCNRECPVSRNQSLSYYHIWRCQLSCANGSSIATEKPFYYRK